MLFALKLALTLPHVQITSCRMVRHSLPISNKDNVAMPHCWTLSLANWTFQPQQNSNIVGKLNFLKIGMYILRN